MMLEYGHLLLLKQPIDLELEAFRLSFRRRESFRDFQIFTILFVTHCRFSLSVVFSHENVIHSDQYVGDPDMLFIVKVAAAEQLVLGYLTGHISIYSKKR